MNLNLFDVVIMNVEGIIQYRDTKHCICISILNNKYFVINTDHRQMYDDFKIEAKNYPFLNAKDRFIACFKIHTIDPDRKIKTVGKLNIEDITKIITKIKNSKTIHKTDKDLILPEIENWLSRL